MVIDGALASSTSQGNQRSRVCGSRGGLHVLRVKVRPGSCRRRVAAGASPSVAAAPWPWLSAWPSSSSWSVRAPPVSAPTGRSRWSRIRLPLRGPLASILIAVCATRMPVCVCRCRSSTTSTTTTTIAAALGMLLANRREERQVR